ncbi:uncharacterized protein LOC131671047 [Phymastichus coffea]|uniref:uncharacterized protein LOC131671047 n=1 Tax=Phymastichus coffea TaxID=108790 RepID=UPI00273BCE87|nr:uncharacterized protein LOC131671047 [Phymastichus coffea]
MFRHNIVRESFIPVDLEEPLTGQACTEMVIEIIKYIMYQKQQIPLSCDSLMKLHANSKPTDRNFSLMQNLVSSMYNVSSHLSSQFNIEDCTVKEILIVIGATIVSPKISIRLELPDSILNSKMHLRHQHSVRKALLSVMKSFCECSEFQDELAIPLEPTNTFILVNKKDPYKISEFFVPKPQFDLSTQKTASFHIKFNYIKNNQLNCNCDRLVHIYHDSDENNIVEKLKKCDSNVSYQWYQSREIFKGFKFLR